MIQYPTNVSPENVAVLPSRREVSFTFNGDILSSTTYRVHDYDTGAIVSESLAIRNDLSPLGYNGTMLPWNAIDYSILTSGRNYTLQMMFTQHTADNFTPIYDMVVLSGVISSRQPAIGSSATRILVGKNVSAFYPWGGNSVRYPTYDDNNHTHLLAGMVIQYGNERRFITSYTPDFNGDDGLIEIESAFTNNLVAGTPYQIYSNFIITPQYYFSCRSNPTITLTHECFSNRILCNGTYSQTDNSLIKYYQLELQWSNNSGFVNSDNTSDRMESVATTGKIYSQQIYYNFWNPYRSDNRGLLTTTDYYRIICTVVTNDNQVYTSSPYVFSITPEDYSSVLGNTLYAYDLSWDRDLGRVLHTLRGYESGGIGVLGTYELFREDLDSGEIVQIQPNFNKTLGVAIIQGYDATASTHGRYKYTLKRFDADGGIIIPVISSEYEGDDPYPSDTIETSECAYYITDLTVNESLREYHPNSQSNEKIRCDMGDTWKFVGEINDTTVVNNLDRVVHVGNSRYVSTTSTDVDYMSGTLSAMLGYVNCMTKKYVDDISLVKAWRKFITQKKMFLLKSQKGDVWVVNITDSPSTQYQENHPQIPTTFTFSWAECANIKDLMIYDPV